jgi:transposase
VTRISAEFREKLEPFYGEVGRPSINPELMIRMVIVGYCYGIRFERKLCEEVELHLAYRWFSGLDVARCSSRSTSGASVHSPPGVT